MSDALFDFGSTDEPQTGPVHQRDIPVKDHQVQQIREGLDAAEVMDQDERQRTIQSYVARQVSSLRDLHAHEAHAIIQRLKQLRTAGPTKTGSVWDQRDEDTWIDKL
ncbi:hypothetical protein [Arthrobacter antibioticus]|uniref:hypothetical protein n=1 Tax=Arthrobacter sp. H35-MC1 TaxID=3046203 RepID=UPI0024BB2520|nr:hypothetical protein [Arthrobacter sp. H35-MC1]MDJ0318380.1 hypothetical protein [Arthrobacter sp. H35-MC1]